MDEKKVNKLLDSFDSGALDNALKTIGKMSELELARLHAKHEDTQALSIGIDKITIFLHGGERQALLIKPNGHIPTWTLNMHDAGVVSLAEGSEPTFTLTDVSVGEGRYRFTMENKGTIYWVDLIDGVQAQELAVFLGIKVVE